MRIFWRIAQRYHAARYRRAARVSGPHAPAADWHKRRSEKFFSKIKGARKQ